MSKKSLSKLLLCFKNNGLKEKEAVSNRQRVYYFRGEAFHELTLALKDEILPLLAKHNKFEKLDDLEDSKLLGDLFMNNHIMKSFGRVPDEVKKFKYPKKLLEVKSSMTDKGFYGFDIIKSQTKMTILAVGLAVSIIAIILFPLWPYSVKLAIFNIMFYFSASIIGLTIVRLILFLLLFPFGISFWIFPNMFSDDLGIFESFIPFLEFIRRTDDWTIFTLRILMILVFSAY